MNISVTMDESDISRILRQIIDHPNKDEFVKLFSYLIADNHKVANYFIKLHVGSKLPEVLQEGTICTIKTKHIYGINSSKEEITCIIKEFKGYHNWSDYFIEYRDDSDTLQTTTVSVEYLNPLDEF